MREWHYARTRISVYVRGQQFIGPLLLLLVGVGLAASAGGDDGDGAMMAITALVVGLVLGVTLLSSETAVERALAASWFAGAARPWCSRIGAVQALLILALLPSCLLLGLLSSAPMAGVVAFVAAFTSGSVGAIWGLTLGASVGDRPGVVVLGGVFLFTATVPISNTPLRWLVSPAARLTAVRDAEWTPLLTASVLQGLVALTVACGVLAVVVRYRPFPR